MGRRAKNKQAPPEPLDAKQYSSPKKLGKRKADAAPAEKPRAVKKSKDSKSKSRVTAHDDDDAGASDGWEGVQDVGVMCEKTVLFPLSILIFCAAETWTVF